jgi:hypothetical protein
LTRCEAELPLAWPLGEITLRCAFREGHGGRHESPPPSDLPLSWPASERPAIVWGLARRRQPRKHEPRVPAPTLEPPTAATLARAQGYL